MNMIDAIVDRCIAIMMPKVVQMIAQSGAIDREGIVIKGTYDPTDGTATVAFGDTAAVFRDEGDTPILIPRVPIKSPHVGDQYGVMGDERVKISATQSGYAAEMVHGPDDSPGAPAGERWIAHRNKRGAYDLYLKITNDAATVGDGKAGFRVSGAGLISFVTTGGLILTMDDATSKVMIGRGNLTNADAVVTATDLQESVNAIISSVQTAINIMSLRAQPGTGPAAPTIAAVTATGSTIVDSAE